MTGAPRLVTVELIPTRPTARCGGPRHRPVPAALRARGGRLSRPYVLPVPAGGARPVPFGPLDEHLAVDVDRCREPWALACADVLYAGCPRPAGAALGLLIALRAAHPGCPLAAVPLVGGVWAAAAGSEGRVLTLPCQEDPRDSLLPSCLHAWLVAGGSPGAFAPPRAASSRSASSGLVVR